MNGINILVEAKNEYTNQLKKILSARIYEGFKSIYEDIINISSKELQEKNIQTSSVIKTFQKSLKEIPQWNQDMIKNEYNRIEKISNCDFIESLIEAVFITNTKILTSVQINDNKSLNVKINIPQPSYFIHKCYMESAKEFYKNPYIFDQSKGLSPKEKHNNLREALSLIDTSINNAISNLLPIKDILKQGLTKFKANDESNKSEENSYLSEEETEESIISDNVTKTSTKSTKSSKSTIKEQIEQNGGKEIIEILEINNDKKINEELHNKSEINESEINVSEINESEINISEINKLEIMNDDNNFKLISKYPIPAKNPISLKLSNTNDVTKTEEYKNINYDKNLPSYPVKIKNIEKIENLNEITKEKKIEPFIQNIQKTGGSNPFVKNIKQSKFIKNKLYGLDKNNSFYKKKYEENSANYNSITDTIKDNVETTLLETINDIKETKDSLKIIKNKIMLKEASSDEESENELVL